jgi:hypothetical protein
MDRRSFLAVLAAGPALFGMPAMAGRERKTRTRWVVRGSEGFDALSFLSPLSGDPFYLKYYEKEVAEFTPRMPPEAMATLKALKQRAEQANILFSPFLDLRFSAGPDTSIDQLLESAARPEERILPAYRSSPYWDDSDAADWPQFKAALPSIATVLRGLESAGFPDYHRRIMALKSKRIAALQSKLAGFDPVAGAEFYTGRSFDPTVEIILLHFCKPHGIKVIGQRFLSAVDWADDVHIRTAGHEILHPPIDMDGEAAKTTLAVLASDPVVQRIVKEHDPKFGYNSLEGIFEEDLVSAIDQLIAERFGVARNPRERWNTVDGGMHVLSAGFYGLMKQDGFARTGGNLEQWLLGKARSGALAPPLLHSAAAGVLGRLPSQLWPLPEPSPSAQRG